MDIESTGQGHFAPNHAERIIDYREHNGTRWFFVEWSDTSLEPSWVMENNERRMQRLIKQFEKRFHIPPKATMNIQQYEHLKQTWKSGYSPKVHPHLKQGQKLGLEYYDKLSNAEIKDLIDRYISKIQKTVARLKIKKQKNINSAIVKVLSFFKENDELGLVIQYNGSPNYRYISYKDMKEYHPYELRLFLEGHIHTYNNNFLQGLFQKNYRYQAHFLGQIFDKNWKKMPNDYMIRQSTSKNQPNQTQKYTLGSDDIPNLFAVEFNLDYFLNVCMIDEAEETKRQEVEESSEDDEM